MGLRYLMGAGFLPLQVGGGRCEGWRRLVFLLQHGTGDPEGHEPERDGGEAGLPCSVKQQPYRRAPHVATLSRLLCCQDDGGEQSRSATGAGGDEEAAGLAAVVGGLLPHLKDYLLEVITSSSAGSTGSAAASAPGSCPTSHTRLQYLPVEDRHRW